MSVGEVLNAIRTPGTLHVADEAAIDVGTLLGWSLDITPGAAVPEPSTLALCIGGLIAVAIGALKRS